MSPTSTTLSASNPRIVDAIARTGATTGARASDRLAAAHDASHYLLTPQLTATPHSAGEVGAVLAAAAAEGLAVTFRSGGTSLSGQAGTEGILLDTRQHFRSIDVLAQGAEVRCGPGATVRAVNARLARYRRKLGPDPASEIACTIGGVVANNSSGMSCGVDRNTYRTLKSAVLVLPSGTVLDTSSADADAELRRTEPAIHDGLLRLRDRVRADPASVERLRRLHAIKNTMGYGLNSFLDHDRPIDILEHLVVGSEGTLAFVAEATFKTVPLHTHLSTALLLFPDLATATSALPALVAAGFATIELLDSTSLRVAQRDPEATSDIRALQVVEHAALLVEFQEETDDGLRHREADAETLLAALPLITPGRMSRDAARRAQLWHLRKGLYTLVAGARPPATTALLEDIAVPVSRLYETCRRLTALFEQFGYEDAVIFGHAKDGNVHFMLTERFDDAGSLARYEAFTDAMVDLVLEQQGTLKAEHGTGRIMAPFVRRQYGDELYEVMCELKALIDPRGTLNPGVLLTEDPAAHVRHLKTALPVEAEVDRCVECGYCEPVCPSKDLTLTPRERIVLRRERERARAAGDDALVAELDREYRYDGVQTCAVDGMCQTACPVLINTGDLVRRLRTERQPAIAQTAWKTTAGHWGAVSSIGAVALTVADRLPAALPAAATSLGRALLGADTVPHYSAELPAGGARRPKRKTDHPAAVYFSSCTTTMFGPGAGGGGVAESFLRLCDRAGVAVSTPDDLPSLCCGTPWKSKGLSAGYERMREAVTASLSRATDGGRLPVVCDASSCTEGLELLLASAEELSVRIIDSVQFVADHLLPRLPDPERVPLVSVHPTCSSTRLGCNDALIEVASAAAEEVHVPDDWGCCAFAGDRGMLHPELTASATAREGAEVAAMHPDAHVSLNRTCELGMTRAVGRPYQHVLELLDRAMPPEEHQTPTAGAHT